MTCVYLWVAGHIGHVAGHIKEFAKSLMALRLVILVTLVTSSFFPRENFKKKKNTHKASRLHPYLFFFLAENLTANFFHMTNMTNMTSPRETRATSGHMKANYNSFHMTNMTSPRETRATSRHTRAFFRHSYMTSMTGAAQKPLPPPIGDDDLAQIQGLPLLPDDWFFMQAILARTPVDRHGEVLAEYRRIWLAAAEQEPDENRRDNQGRRAANLFLLRRNT